MQEKSTVDDDCIVYTRLNTIVRRKSVIKTDFVFFLITPLSNIDIGYGASSKRRYSCKSFSQVFFTQIR